MTIIKICGLRTVDHALAAATAGADMVGLVFAPSRRQISIELAAALVAELRHHPAGKRVWVVGVFVNASAAELNATALGVGLDYVQISGDETPEVLEGLESPWISTIRLDDSPREQRWLATEPGLLHIDSHTPGSYGGSGLPADWSRAALVAAQRPILLAGGLTPENVGNAVAQVQPWGVDVSSGVEVNGVKDTERIQAFVAAVRRSASS